MLVVGKWVVMGIEQSLNILGKCCTTEPHPHLSLSLVVLWPRLLDGSDCRLVIPGSVVCVCVYVCNKSLH